VGSSGAEEERQDLREAIRDAFAEIRRQLDRYRENVTHASEYERLRDGNN